MLENLETLFTSTNIKLALLAFALGLITYEALKKILRSTYAYPVEISFKNRRLGSNSSEFLENLQKNHETYLELLKEEYPDECTLSLGSFLGGEKKFVFLNSIESVKKFSKSGKNSEPIPNKPKSFLLDYISKGYLGSFFRMYDKKLLEIRKSSLAGLHKLTSDPSFEPKLIDEITHFFEYLNNQYIDGKKLFEKENETKFYSLIMHKEDGFIENAPIYIEQISTNMITMIGLGVRFDYDSNPNSDIKKQINNISEALNSLNMPNIMNFEKNDAYLKRDVFNYLKSRVDSVYDFLLNAIVGYKTNVYESDVINTFADFVISKQTEANRKNKLNDDDNYSDKDILVQVFTLLMAGTCTTGFTLSWAFYYLSRDLKIQEKIYNEIVKNVGTDSLILPKNKFQLPYAEACVNEILRLSSTQALIGRATQNKINIDSYVLPEDTTVFINAYSINRDSKYWKSKELNPDQWFDENKNLKSYLNSFVPFGTSPRICLGESLSRDILFLVISNFVQRYHFEYVADKEHEFVGVSGNLGVMRRPFNYHLKITRRS